MIRRRSMKFNSKSFWCLALIILSICFFAPEASAASNNILVEVKNRAVSLLLALRPLIFIVAGFGLIGFAWGAIFGKINWKWFANIAMGLFLVANVGLFIDYFASNDGSYKKLGYGKYMEMGYNATAGSDEDPSSQEDPGEGTAGESESGENADCVPGTGVNCEKSGGNGESTDNGLMKINTTPEISEEEKAFDEENIIEGDQEKSDRENCQILGGTWNGATCDFGNETIDEDALKAAEKDLNKDQKEWTKEQKEQQKAEEKAKKEQQKAEEKAKKEAEKAEKEKREAEYKKLKEQTDKEVEVLEKQLKTLEKQTKEEKTKCKDQKEKCEENVSLKLRQNEVNCANNYAQTSTGSDYNNESYKKCINALDYMKNSLSSTCTKQNDSCMKNVKTVEDQMKDLENRISGLKSALKKVKDAI